MINRVNWEEQAWVASAIMWNRIACGFGHVQYAADSAYST